MTATTQYAPQLEGCNPLQIPNPSFLVEYSKKMHEVEKSIGKNEPSLLINRDQFELAVVFALLRKKERHWKDPVFVRDFARLVDEAIGPVDQKERGCDAIYKRRSRYKEKLCYAGLIHKENHLIKTKDLPKQKYITIHQDMLSVLPREVLPLPAILLWGLFVINANTKGGKAVPVFPMNLEAMGVSPKTIRKWASTLSALGMIMRHPADTGATTR